MVTVFVYRNGQTMKTERVEPQWLDPGVGRDALGDVVRPTAEDGQRLLTDTFHFHPLSVEDALSELHHPKIEAYEGYLYIILHGIDFRPGEHEFATARRRFLPRRELSRHRPRRPIRAASRR
jgi:magnesium transporter